MEVTVDFSELGKLQTLLDGAANHATDKMPEILDAVADAVVADAQANSPVLTGAERDSIAVLSRSGNKLVRHRTIGSPLKQAFFQELGTSKHPPQPAILPAVRAGADELTAQMEKLGVIW